MLQLILVFDPNVPPLPYNFHRFVVMPAASWGFYPNVCPTPPGSNVLLGVFLSTNLRPLRG